MYMHMHCLSTPLWRHCVKLRLLIAQHLSRHGRSVARSRCSWEDPYELNGEVAGLSLGGDPAQFGELIDARFPAKASVAGRPDTSEGHLRLVMDGGAVDVTNPGADLTGNAQPARRVARENRGG